MGSDIWKAMILAAGEGTRLVPLTSETSKVLLPVGEKPLIGYIISWLISHGISEVAINLYRYGEKIKEFLSSGSHFGVKISYSQEERLLGTAGAVKRMERFFTSTFVVVYGDILTDFDLKDMIQFHREKKGVATLAIFKVANPSEVGVVEMNEERRILSFVEKPPCGSERSNLGSGGVYVLEKRILNYIPSKGPCDFGYDVFPKLMELGIPVYGYVLKPEDYILDIGTIEKYWKANEDVKARRLKIRYQE